MKASLLKAETTGQVRQSKHDGGLEEVRLTNEEISDAASIAGAHTARAELLKELEARRSAVTELDQVSSGMRRDEVQALLEEMGYAANVVDDALDKVCARHRIAQIGDQQRGALGLPQNCSNARVKCELALREKLQPWIRVLQTSDHIETNLRERNFVIEIGTITLRDIRFHTQYGGRLLKIGAVIPETIDSPAVQELVEAAAKWGAKVRANDCTEHFGHDNSKSYRSHSVTLRLELPDRRG